MTYEEAINFMRYKQTQVCFRECSAHCGNYVECDFCMQMEIMDTAIEALEKAEKYRWHDLRKNPEDDPRKDGLYCVAMKYDTDIEVGFGQWENMYGYGSGWSALMPNIGKVIAWREIEPFEE